MTAPLPVAIILAKQAIAAAPGMEMARYAAQLEATGRVSRAVYAYSEQGDPSLKSVVHRLRDEGEAEILILPLLLPMEPAYYAWIVRTLQRWHVEAGGAWPTFHIGRALGEKDDLTPVLLDMLDSAAKGPPPVENPKAWTEGSVVSDRKYRVLVCQGGPCNQAGAPLVWGHLRNEQVRLKLMDRGEGMRSAKATCLGPCALGPVVQVYPEGVFYGGVDEAGMDRIIQEHLGEGRIVEDLAYAPAEGKQRLRSRPSPGA